MEIKVYATLRDVVGAPNVYLENQSAMAIGQILQALCAQFPGMRSKLTLDVEEMHPAVHILINGRDMRYLNGLETVVTPQDVIRIFPPVGGGT